MVIYLSWLLDVYYAYAFGGVRPIGVVSHWEFGLPKRH